MGLTVSNIVMYLILHLLETDVYSLIFFSPKCSSLNTPQSVFVHSF